MRTGCCYALKIIVAGQVSRLPAVGETVAFNQRPLSRAFWPFIGLISKGSVRLLFVRTSPFASYRPEAAISLTVSIGQCALRPWPQLSEIVRLLQSGRMIEGRLRPPRADGAPTEVASATTGVRPIATVRLRAHYSPPSARMRSRWSVRAGLSGVAGKGRNPSEAEFYVAR
jgi:hypothetical protein